MSNELDLDTMPLDELAKLANDNFDQPRDEQGRFAAKQDDQTAADDQPDEIVYRRVIDLGDGSGVQVFEAPSPEELIEKLAIAQEHATRKIRELAAAAKAVQPPPEPVIDPNEEFLLSQELLQTPTKAYAKLFKKMTGVDISEFRTVREKLTAFEQAQKEESAAAQFVQTHPDYYNSPKNNAKMEKWIRMHGLEGTPENIERAFVDLQESGLLETRPATPDAETNEERVSRQRIAAPTTRLVGQRRAASGLSSRRSVAAPAKPELTEDDLYKMSYEQLEELARREAQEAQR